MISQDSNNRPSGSTAVQCDAGIPIMGRTGDTGVYQILKVNADGSLPTPSVTIPTFPDLITPTVNVLAPAGAFAANIIIAYDGGFVTVATAGNFIIRPFFMANLTVLGAVNMYVVKAGSVLDTYIQSRAIGVDSYTPAITDYVNGLSAAYHNVSNQNIGTNVGKTFVQNNTAQTEYFLEAADYKLLVVVHTALTTGSTTIYNGYESFTPKT
jgi:hypothetical protein